LDIFGRRSEAVTRGSNSTLSISLAGNESPLSVSGRGEFALADPSIGLCTNVCLECSADTNTNNPRDLERLDEYVKLPRRRHGHGNGIKQRPSSAITCSLSPSHVLTARHVLIKK